MAKPRALNDAASRSAVVERLDETMFVEAGAGSGKTRCLVDRFVALVEAGVPADTIAAITFTEHAAGELADRIRAALQGRAEASPLARAALDALDRAAIGTLHSFARRILSEHPIEAGLPPRIEVMDEIASQVAFQRRWESFVDRLLDDPDLDRPLRLLLAGGAGLDERRDVALAFDDNWDLVAERAGTPSEVPEINVDGLCAALDAICAERERCRDTSDLLYPRLDAFAAYAADLRAATDEDTRFEMLHRRGVSFNLRVGRQENWSGITPTVLRGRIAAAGAQRDALTQSVLRSCVEHLATALAQFTISSARERQAAGRLEFHDLLVLARAVLRDPVHGTAVRASLHDRFARLLLDELQDTDPIQIELAVLIAAPPGGGDVPAHWTDIAVAPGRLFLVGDPKQSIYRFRRADVGVFLDARDTLVPAAIQLTSNFRTAAPIVEWVNRTFETLIVEKEGCQPAYVALDATQPAPPRGPAVTFVGHDELPPAWRADDVRATEAAAIATIIHRAVTEGWNVRDDAGGYRPASWRDVCILLPARTSLAALERALEAAAIPYRAETSSLVYATREIRDLLAVARAVEDPTDELSLVTALRSAAFGCGDDDLFTWRNGLGGRWDHQAGGPDGAAEHPVGQAMAWLRDLHRERAWLAPSAVLDRIVRERRLMEIAASFRRPRDLWRRLRFVVDQARAWEEAAGGTLRDYLTWVALQAAESARVVETVLPETDDESVRIMTIHGAKGLEFPITVLSGLTTQLRARRRGVQVTFPPAGGWGIRLGSGITTAEFDAYQPIDEQMDHEERLRLLYVGATRARDHLVVSVHRKARNGGNGGASTAAELFWQHGRHEKLITIPDNVLPLTAAQPAPSPAPVPEGWLPYAEWRADRDRAMGRAARRRAWSATAVAEEVARLTADDDAGLAKDPRDLDLPPWQKGRYGTAIGRAVHAVLQTIDLATGAGLDDAAAAQAAAEGVLGREPIIAALARAALASDVVRYAITRPHWREMYVGAPAGDGVLEGYVDLLYRDDDGLVIVDYKTDAWRDDDDLDAKVARYRPQLAAYARCVAAATGEPVARAVLLFLSDAGAVAREIDGLAGAVDTVTAVMAR